MTNAGWVWIAAASLVALSGVAQAQSGLQPEEDLLLSVGGTKMMVSTASGSARLVGPGSYSQSLELPRDVLASLKTAVSNARGHVLSPYSRRSKSVFVRASAETVDAIDIDPPAVQPLNDLLVKIRGQLLPKSPAAPAKLSAPPPLRLIWEDWVVDIDAASAKAELRPNPRVTPQLTPDAFLGRAYAANPVATLKLPKGVVTALTSAYHRAKPGKAVERPLDYASKPRQAWADLNTSLVFAEGTGWRRVDLRAPESQDLLNQALRIRARALRAAPRASWEEFQVAWTGGGKRGWASLKQTGEIVLRYPDVEGSVAPLTTAEKNLLNQLFPRSRRDRLFHSTNWAERDWFKRFHSGRQDPYYLTEAVDGEAVFTKMSDDMVVGPVTHDSKGQEKPLGPDATLTLHGQTGRGNGRHPFLVAVRDILAKRISPPTTAVVSQAKGSPPVKGASAQVEELNKK